MYNYETNADVPLMGYHQVLTEITRLELRRIALRLKQYDGAQSCDGYTAAIINQECFGIAKRVAALFTHKKLLQTRTKIGTLKESKNAIAARESWRRKHNVKNAYKP